MAPAYGLAGVEGVADARERLRHALGVQIAAFPQHGVIRTPGTAQLLEKAARTGAIDMPRRDMVVHGGVVVARDGAFLD